MENGGGTFRSMERKGGQKFGKAEWRREDGEGRRENGGGRSIWKKHMGE